MSIQIQIIIKFVIVNLARQKVDLFRKRKNLFLRPKFLTLIQLLPKEYPSFFNEEENHRLLLAPCPPSLPIEVSLCRAKGKFTSFFSYNAVHQDSFGYIMLCDKISRKLSGVVSFVREFPKCFLKYELCIATSHSIFIVLWNIVGSLFSAQIWKQFCHTFSKIWMPWFEDSFFLLYEEWIHFQFFRRPSRFIYFKNHVCVSGSWCKIPWITREARI